MIQPIVTDYTALTQPSIVATTADRAVIQDLKDTLSAHQDHCIGLAANMIGVHKRMLIVGVDATPFIMINPKYVAKQDPYPAEEGCLSLEGTRETTRYNRIIVSYLDEHFRKQRASFTGLTAQVIQHEMDHFEGRLI